MGKFPSFRAALAVYRSWVTTNRVKYGIGGTDPEKLQLRRSRGVAVEWT